MATGKDQRCPPGQYGMGVIGSAAGATGHQPVLHVAVLQLCDLVTRRMVAFWELCRQAGNALQLKAPVNAVLHICMLKLGDTPCNLQIGGTLGILIQATELLVTMPYCGAHHHAILMALL